MGLKEPMEKANMQFAAYLKKTTKKAGQVFIISSFALLLGFVAGIIYARLLGADLYGVFQLAFTAVSTLALFTVFGMSGGLVRYIPIFESENNREALKGIVNFSALFSLALSSVGAIALILGKDFVSYTVFKEPRLPKILPIFGFILIFYSLIVVFGGVIRAKKEAPVFVFYNQVLNRTLSVMAFLAFYFLFGMRLLGISWAKLLSSLIVLFFAGKWVLKRFPFLIRKPLLPKIKRKEFMLYSASLLFIGSTYFLMGQVNKLLIGAYTVSKEVGFYSIGNVVAGLVVFVLVSFNAIFAPLISELYHNREYKTLARMYSAITRLVWIFTLPIFLWIAIFSGRILMIFGPEFTAAKWVLIFLAVGQFINAAVGPNGLMLSMSGHQKWEMFNGTAVATLNIALNILLIPKYGAAGSAVGGALALGVVNIVKTLEVWYVMKMIPYNVKFIKPILAGAAGIIGLFLLKRFLSPNIFYTFVAGAAGGILILGVVLLFGLEKEDKLLLDAIKRRISALV